MDTIGISLAGGFVFVIIFKIIKILKNGYNVVQKEKALTQVYNQYLSRFKDLSIEEIFVFRQMCEGFILNIKSLDDVGIGTLVYLMTNFRNSLAKTENYKDLNKWLLEPYKYQDECLVLLPELQAIISHYENQGQVETANSIIVWAITIMGNTKVQLTPYSINLWRELQRGINYCKNNEIPIVANMDVDGFDKIPKLKI